MTQPFDWALFTELVVPRLGELFDELGVWYRETNKYYWGPCPVHGSRKYQSMILYKNTGIWRCFTNSCHDKHGKGLVGLFKGILDTTDNEALKFIYKTLDINPSDLTLSKEQAEIRTFTQLAGTFENCMPDTSVRFTREQVRERLVFPAEYYLNRGYTPQVLDSYDIGICNNPKKFMYNRAVIPIYDELGEYIIGCVGRSIFEQCSKCQMYHNPKTSCPHEFNYRYSKWLSSNGFQKTTQLFNIWKAKRAIDKNNTAVICEGPGDVLRLVESGITNSLAIFGAELSDTQLSILERSNVFNLVILTDQDQAGKKAAELIQAKCSRLFNLVFPKIESKDVGDMTTEEIKDVLQPYFGG